MHLAEMVRLNFLCPINLNSTNIIVQLTSIISNMIIVLVKIDHSWRLWVLPIEIFGMFLLFFLMLLLLLFFFVLIIIRPLFGLS